MSLTNLLELFDGFSYLLFRCVTEFVGMVLHRSLSESPFNLLTRCVFGEVEYLQCPCVSAGGDLRLLVQMTVYSFFISVFLPSVGIIKEALYLIVILFSYVDMFGIVADQPIFKFGDFSVACANLE